MPVSVKIITVSLTLTRRILPKRKLKMSIVNPPEIPIITSPTAIPEDRRTATDASPDILKRFLILVIISALTNDTPYAVQMGYMPDIRPRAMPPKEECAIASPNKEYRLKTRNRPITEHKIAIAIPEIRALCIKLKVRISRDMTNDDAYVLASQLRSIVLPVHHYQRIHRIHRERRGFYSGMQHGLQVC